MPMIRPTREWWDMAELWWSATGYELSPAAGDIGTVMEVLGNALTQNGYEDVAVAGDVHGFKPGIDFFSAVMFLPISGDNFWQVVATGGDGTGAQGIAELDNIKSIIAGLKFL
jgi:hypothetical protein